MVSTTAALNPEVRRSAAVRKSVLAGRFGNSVATRKPVVEASSVPKIYFDERIAAGYDANSTDMFDPAVLDPAVDFLASHCR